jgi:hypothetical protein
MTLFPDTPQFSAAILNLNALQPTFVGQEVRRCMRVGTTVKAGESGVAEVAARIAGALDAAREDMSTVTNPPQSLTLCRSDAQFALAALDHMVSVSVGASLSPEEVATALGRDVPLLEEDTAAVIVDEYRRSFSVGRTRVEQGSVVVPKLMSVQSRLSLRLSSSVTSQERAPEVLMSLNVQDPIGPTEQLQVSLDREQLGEMFLQLQAAQEAIDALR